jgi:hypothetical protein
MVLLYSISKELSINALTFDLFWGFPQSGGDFLDGTCLLYAEKRHYRTFDYKSRAYIDISGMTHSGDVMDSFNLRGKMIIQYLDLSKIYSCINLFFFSLIGHHQITANLTTLPQTVTRLYFVLSAYRSPNIGCFPNPSFKLFDPSYPDTQLCSYTIRSASTSKAVIMCVIEKSNEGNWNIFEIGKLCDGNVLDYKPIFNTISNMDAFI